MPGVLFLKSGSYREVAKRNSTAEVFSDRAHACLQALKIRRSFLLQFEQRKQVYTRKESPLVPMPEDCLDAEVQRKR